MAFANETFTTQTNAHFSCDSAIKFQGVQIQIADGRSEQILATATYTNQLGGFATYATAPNRTGLWIVTAQVSVVGYATFGETAASQAIVLTLDPAGGYNSTEREGKDRNLSGTTPEPSPAPCFVDTCA